MTFKNVVKRSRLLCSTNNNLALLVLGNWQTFYYLHVLWSGQCGHNNGNLDFPPTDINQSDASYTQNRAEVLLNFSIMHAKSTLFILDDEEALNFLQSSSSKDDITICLSSIKIELVMRFVVIGPFFSAIHWKWCNKSASFVSILPSILTCLQL